MKISTLTLHQVTINPNPTPNSIKGKPHSENSQDFRQAAFKYLLVQAPTTTIGDKKLEKVKIAI